MSNFLKIVAISAGLVSTTTLAIPAAPFGQLHQTVAVPSVSADVRILPAAQNTGYVVTAVFRASGSSIHAACLSAYRDLRCCATMRGASFPSIRTRSRIPRVVKCRITTPCVQLVRFPVVLARTVQIVNRSD